MTDATSVCEGRANLGPSGVLSQMATQPNLQKFSSQSLLNTKQIMYQGPPGSKSGTSRVPGVEMGWPWESFCPEAARLLRLLDVPL